MAVGTANRVEGGQRVQVFTEKGPESAGSSGAAIRHRRMEQELSPTSGLGAGIENVNMGKTGGIRFGQKRPLWRESGHLGETWLRTACQPGNGLGLVDRARACRPFDEVSSATLTVGWKI